MNLLRKRPGVPSDDARRLKEWARELWELPDDAALVVMELACQEPGCPPVETVVATLEAAAERRSVKLHGSAGAITREEFVRAVTRGG